jgi:hypothetical protein
MKYSNYIGVVVAIGLVATCFMPWVYISSIQTTITGLKTPQTNFGKPGLINMVLSSLSIILFLTRRIWAKRTNILITALNLAWTARNVLIITQCYAGECPEKQAGIYLMPALSVALFLMALLPEDLTKP